MSLEHTVKAYEEELSQLTSDVQKMGGIAEAALLDALAAVTRRDVALASQVIDGDKELDALETEIERQAVRLIARRQPMADDLRKGVAAMKIANNLERAGDLAKNISKRALILAEAEPMTKLTRSIDRLGKLVVASLKDVLDAYSSGEVDKAVRVWNADQDIDDHYNSLFRELLTYMMGDPRTITPCSHLLFIAKNLERIGDHVTNIAELVHYEITGQALDARPKRDNVGEA
ncbi:MAG: phosphate uptake regulator, PhoU [Caulobacteraceae bacterium]|nr:phosphate uptake regulator, PhoU [Caulobacteraceae bacterium]